MKPEDSDAWVEEALQRLESTLMQRCLRDDGLEAMLDWLLPELVVATRSRAVLLILTDAGGFPGVHRHGLDDRTAQQIADLLLDRETQLRGPWKQFPPDQTGEPASIEFLEMPIPGIGARPLSFTEDLRNDSAERLLLMPLRPAPSPAGIGPGGGLLALLRDLPSGPLSQRAGRIGNVVSTGLAIHEVIAAARNSHAESDALLGAAVDSVVVIDETGIIETVNAAAERTFGWKKEEVVGRNVSMLMPDPYRREHDGYIRNYVTTGQAKIIGIGREVQAVRRDGTVFPVDLSVGEIVSARGRRRFLGLVRDVSIRKQTEHQLQEARERLAHVARISTMGEMASGIAHEVNQPLTAIATYANACRRLLHGGRVDDPDLAEGLEQIAEEARRAGQIIHRLRALTRREQSERKACDINGILLDVIRLAEVDTRHHDVRLEVSFGEDLPPVQADPVQIQQVVLNLIRNATDSMEHSSGQERIVRVQTRQKRQKEIEVDVTDHGAGLPDRIREEDLFAPFFTTKPTGMGLGLSISRSIVQSHGGKLWYSRNPDGGTTFHFTLPASVAERNADEK